MLNYTRIADQRRWQVAKENVMIDQFWAGFIVVFVVADAIGALVFWFAIKWR